MFANIVIIRDVAVDVSKYSEGFEEPLRLWELSDHAQKKQFVYPEILV